VKKRCGKEVGKRICGGNVGMIVGSIMGEVGIV